MIKLSTKLRVRYADTDSMGVVYHSNYIVYLEVGRTELMRQINLSYNDLESTHQIAMPVVDINCKYKRPAFYDDVLEIKTWVSEIPFSARINFNYEIYRMQNDLPIVTANTTLAFVSLKNKKTIRCPDFVKEALKKNLF